MKKIRNVCFVSREYGGLAEAGGLKDVVRGLAVELASAHRDVTVILPRYGFLPEGNVLRSFDIQVAGVSPRVQVIERLEGPVRVLMLDHPIFGSKQAVYTYTRHDAPAPNMIGRGHIDAVVMNAVFQEGAVRAMMADHYPPDVVHGHDGHTGLLPLYMRHLPGAREFFRETGVVVTIHNAGIAYQQNTGTVGRTAELTGLSETALSHASIADTVVPFLAAGVYAHLSTVSPQYARELLTGAEEHSGLLGAELRARGIPIRGIYNGADAKEWQASVRIPCGSANKEKLRRAVVQELTGGEFPGIELFGAVPDANSRWVLFHGRITHQKGVPGILAMDQRVFRHGADVQMILYGQGDPALEDQAVRRVSRDGNWTFLKGYDSRLTNRLIAASTIILVPSLWEPCGQVDMMGQALGALPLVSDVGGLRKIRDGVDGYRYSSVSPNGLEKKLQQALDWEDKRPGKVRRMRRRAENVVYGRRSWRKVLVRGYLPLYRKAIKHIRHQ